MKEYLPYLTLIGCYLIGSIPFGLLLARINGINIREHGSGNIGATNVLRTLGKKWGISCFVLDFLKGCLPVLTCKILLVPQQNPGWLIYLPLLALICTVCGHIFSVFVNFKGGKGVATAAGAIAAIAPLPLIISFVFWFIVFKKSGYVSLASILAAVALPVIALTGKLSGLPAFSISTVELIFFSIIGLLIVYMHRSNIKRLREGSENSFKKKKTDNS